MAWNLLKHLFGTDKGQADVAAIDADWATVRGQIEAVWVDFAKSEEAKGLETLGVAPTLEGAADIVEKAIPEGLLKLGVPSATVTALDGAMTKTFELINSQIPKFTF